MEIDNLLEEIKLLNERVTKLEQINKKRKILRLISFIIGLVLIFIIAIVYINYFSKLFEQINF